MFFQIDVLQKLCNRKIAVFEFLSNKVAGLNAGNFIKKKLQHRFFLMNTAKSLATVLFIEHFWWLFLSV